MVDFEPKVKPIRIRLADYQNRKLRVFATSSFQSNSVVLLHLISQTDRSIPVYFMDTGFHFPETLRFRDDLESRLGLDIRILRSPVNRIQQRDRQGRLLFASDPDHCCHLNKVLPLEPVLLSNDVWISGVRASQSDQRAQMGEEAKGRHGILRYHPLLEWTARDVHYYIEEHSLPRHPLEDENFFSIGCRPCTRKIDLNNMTDGRGGRWFGMNKTECGLHLDVDSSTGVAQ
jgi:phosphoadenosine phosphosulfate reductase